jgi:ketosteroid isomerase-like protein
MMPDRDLNEFIEVYHKSIDAFLHGNLEPQMQLWSRREDVTLANPLGPPAHGWREVEKALKGAASQIVEGETVGSERITLVVTAELAYILEIERDRVRVSGAAELAASSLRVTSIFRLEGGEWKLVHRHADPITSARTIATVLER